MSWIRTVGVDEARGRLRELYDQAVRRAGRVFGIVRVMSPAPHALEASMGLYRALMFGPSPLSRRQRELLAVVVSRANACHY
jgi:alkylhydroperoxidase family enzyme